MSQLNRYTPISLGPNDCINDITFDGCNYFATLECQCEILMLNIDFKPIKRLSTYTVYDRICYDWKDHCFWVTSRCCPIAIYKLNCDMNEIDSIYVNSLSYNGVITGITYNCCSDSILISYASLVVELSKDDGR